MEEKNMSAELDRMAEHERRMIEAYAHDLEVDYLTSDEKKRSVRQLLERQEKAELLDAICNFIVERGI